MNRAIELGWIARQDKSLILPELVFGPDDDCGGKYFEPFDCEEIIQGTPVDRRNGIIFISTDFADEVAENIAHEWRHHWQAHHGWNLEPAFYWNKPVDYARSIVAYFMGSYSEADALRFQTQHAGCCDYWRDLLIPAGFHFS